MTREDAIKVLNMVEAHGLADEAKRMAIKALEHPEQNVIAVVPCGDAISRQAALDAFGLSEKTRKYGGDHSGYDTMMLYEIQQTLEDLPSVTPKAEPCDDAISRDAVWGVVQELWGTSGELMDRLMALPSVKPQEPKTGHCKDCKWWKDSDGVYRRGFRAESSCPFNTKEIYDGDAYCYRFELQESEEENG